MSTKITMPQLSPTMTKGVIANWFVAVGDEVKEGDLIVEVETDKVSIEVEANDSGVVSQLAANIGDEVEVDAVIARLAPVGTKIEKLETELNVLASESAGALPPQTSNESNLKKEPSKVSTIVIPESAKISPVAKRMAMQNQIDISKIEGTGSNGKIVKKDIDKALNIDWNAKLAVSNSMSEAEVVIDYDALPKFNKQPITSMRNVVASRLTASSRDIPHFYMSVDCNIDQLLEVRKTLNERTSDDTKISVNDLVIKAVSKAFRKVPDANVMWAGDSLLSFDDVDISIAVAIKDGLITPVLKKADKLSISEISAGAKALVDKARNGKLAPNEYQGGTFTISNLGMFGIKNFTSIINPPQCGILSVGAGEKMPVVIDDELTIATMMTLTLAMDHRCVDGATGAKYLQVLKHLIEDPMSLLL